MTNGHDMPSSAQGGPNYRSNFLARSNFERGCTLLLLVDPGLIFANPRARFFQKGG